MLHLTVVRSSHLVVMMYITVYRGLVQLKGQRSRSQGFIITKYAITLKRMAVTAKFKLGISMKYIEVIA